MNAGRTESTPPKNATQKQPPRAQSGSVVSAVSGNHGTVAAKPSKGTAKSSRKTRTGTTVDAQQRHQMIAEAAYYLAEKRGFNGGDPEQDWLTAAAEIDARLLTGR